ncbi:MAG: hypothetical protein GY814_16865 [Gammaproteobacteria bacterium]|nr:hypothetical protein [Gammaproteobacteria bacterium]
MVDYLKRAKQAEIGWPIPLEMQERDLGRLREENPLMFNIELVLGGGLSLYLLYVFIVNI